MPDGIGQRQRRDLARTEEGARRRVLTIMKQVETRLERRVRLLWKTIEEQRAAGVDVRPSILFEQNRLSRLLAELKTEIDNASLKLGLITEKTQRKAIRQAQKDLLRIASADETLTASLEGLDVPAVEKLVGFGSGKSKLPLAKLYQRIGEPLAGRLERSLVFGIVTGQDTRAIAREVRSVLNTTTAHAYTIARTELNNAYREASRAAINENKEHFKGYMWIAALDLRTCPICWRFHGKIFPTKQKFRSHVNCRCTLVAILNEAEPIETGIERFAKLTEAQQNTILGKGRFDLYKAGHGLDSMVAYQKTDYGKTPFLVNIGDLAKKKPVTIAKPELKFP